LSERLRLRGIEPAMNRDRVSRSSRRAVRGALLVSCAILLVAAFAGAGPNAPVYQGRVIDGLSKSPIEDAIVTLNDRVVRTDRNGFFRIEGAGRVLGVRACGYLRTSVALSDLAREKGEIALRWFRPKALYLSYYGIGSRKLREAALSLIHETELNAVVIDVKGDRGWVSYRTSVALAAETGAQNQPTIKDIGALLQRLHERGIYTIARIVVFKDNVLANARPDLAIRTANGAIYRDREHLAWTNPFRREVWNYNIALAVDAAEKGFDEIQFDYVRCPDVKGWRLGFPGPYNQATRVAAVSGFLAAAKKALVPYNVFVAADIFGYVCWNLDDTGIGQTLDSVARNVDYLCPMLYPSGFQFGIPGYSNPVQHPYEIVNLSLRRALERTHLATVRFRPWIQAFRDYAFGRKPFGGAEIRAQIAAAEDFGSDGWMMWNPSNRYSIEGLKHSEPGFKK
jgi:hypothetical protein